MFTIEHDGQKIDFASLPLASQSRLALRGFVHMYGNEVAAGAIGDFRTKARNEWKSANSDDAWKELTDSEKSAIEKSGIPSTDSDEYKAAIKEGREEFLSKLLAGTLGEGRAAGPRKSPLEVEADRIAKEETIRILLDKGLFKPDGKKRVPKADDEYVIGKETLSFATLCSRRLDRFNDRILGEARKIIAAREKNAAKAAGEDLSEAF